MLTESKIESFLIIITVLRSLLRLIITIVGNLKGNLKTESPLIKGAFCLSLARLFTLYNMNIKITLTQGGRKIRPPYVSIIWIPYCASTSFFLRRYTSVRTPFTSIISSLPSAYFTLKSARYLQIFLSFKII